jgi:hypothetical protein
LVEKANSRKKDRELTRMDANEIAHKATKTQRAIAAKERKERKKEDEKISRKQEEGQRSTAIDYSRSASVICNLSSVMRFALLFAIREALREIILPTHFRDRSFSRVGYNHLRKTFAVVGQRH